MQTDAIIDIHDSTSK